MRSNGHKPSASQEGLASIVVVSVLIVIMTLITVGFARLVNRAAVNSANKQFSASATYAAESGINDVAAYLKKYAVNNPGSNFLPKSTSCTGNGSLIGNSTSPGPFYNATGLASNSSTKYTCLLLDPTPSSLVYTQVENTKSQVVKVNTSASTGALDRLMLSWQPSDNTITGYPPAGSSLYDETTWNDSSHNYVPMLRVAIFPISSGESLSSAQAQSKTVFLYPQASAGNVPARSYSSLSDGSMIGVPCNQSIAGSDFNPTTPTGYKCNIILNGLSTAIAPSNTDSVYMRITPIYNQADVRIATNDKFGNTLNFINDQAVVDVTAQTGGVVKRLQARVDTSTLVSGATGVDTNITSNSNDEPEQSVRSANALCKREVVTQPSLPGYPTFVNFDDPDAVCHDLGSTTTISDPVPTLAFSITGSNGKDSGQRVCSAGDVPETNAWGCTTANNPDSPQSPVQQGTVFVGTSPGSNNGAANISWSTTDATSCTATNGSAGWPGEKLTSASGVNASGSQNISGIGSVTTYSLQCSRPLAPSPTPTKTVTIWPYPQVTSIQQNPIPVRAGHDYTVSWNSNNAVRCSLSSGNWSDSSQTGTSGSETMNWPIDDNSSNRQYTVTCYDPIGRSDTQTINVTPGPCGSNCGSIGGGGGPDVSPPQCSASVTTSGSTTSDATISWSTSCPDWDPANPCQVSRDIEPSPNASGLPGYYQGLGSPCWQASGTIRLTTAGTYSLTASVWADPWGNQADANSTGCSSNCDREARSSATITVHSPITINSFTNSGIWDNSPRCSSPGNWWDKSWWCHWDGSKTTTWPGGGGICADGSHQWTTCSFSYNATAGSDTGSITCTIYSSYGLFYSGGSNGNPGGGFGWGNVGGGGGYGANPNNFTLSCSDPWAIAGSSKYFP